MNRFRILLLILCVSTCFLHSARSQQIRIMTYNIHHGADVTDRSTLDSMVSYIGDSQVDIVGLQEVDSVCNRSGKIDQPFRLGQGTGMDHYFTRHFDYQGGAYGQALLTSYPVTSLRNFRLPVFPLEKGGQVSVLLAELSPAPDRKFTVGVVHLDYRSTESRMHQTDILLDSLAGIKNLVLTGDFNAYPDSPEMLKLLEAFDCYSANLDQYTFPAEHPDRRIDYVLIRKNADLKVVLETVDPVTYSDHLPVVTTLEWKE